MVKLARILTGIVLVLLAFLALVAWGTRLHVQVVAYEHMPAQANADLAKVLLLSASRDDPNSDIYKRPASDDIADYQLITIKLEARNIGLIPAEWARVGIEPSSADVALFADDGITIPGLGQSRELSATLLFEGEPENQQSILLTYYIFGRKLEVAVESLERDS